MMLHIMYVYIIATLSIYYFGLELKKKKRQQQHQIKQIYSFSLVWCLVFLPTIFVFGVCSVLNSFCFNILISFKTSLFDAYKIRKPFQQLHPLLQHLKLFCCCAVATVVLDVVLFYLQWYFVCSEVFYVDKWEKLKVRT